jgi:hypothetical protein
MSSAIRSVGHRHGMLEVEVANGDVYRYFDVPQDVFRKLMRAKSKGVFFNAHIRDSYRVEGPV